MRLLHLQGPCARLEDAGLQDVLRQQLLPQLPLRNLAQLRTASRTLRQLVDDGSGAIWRQAAHDCLSAGTIPDHADGHAAQQRLQVQAAAMRRLRTGDAPRPSPPHRQISQAELQVPHLSLRHEPAYLLQMCRQAANQSLTMSTSEIP